MAEGQIDPGDALAEVARPRKRAMKRLLLATLLVVAGGSGYYYRDYFLGTAAETRPPRPPAAQPEVGEVGSLQRSEEHTSELQSLTNLVCRLLLEKKKKLTKSWTRCRRAP